MRYLVLSCFVAALACDNDSPDSKKIYLEGISVGTFGLNLGNPVSNVNVPVDEPITIRFNNAINTNNLNEAIILKATDLVDGLFTWSSDFKTITFTPDQPLANNETHTITITEQLSGKNGEGFSEITISFTTAPAKLQLLSIRLNGNSIPVTEAPTDISRAAIIELEFDLPLNPASVSSENIKLMGESQKNLNLTLSNNDKTVTVTSIDPLRGLQLYSLTVSNSLGGINEESFDGLNFKFYTEADPNPQFPIISDDELLTLVQQQTFKYFYDYAEPNSGMARERIGSGDLVTTGGTGFGLMAMIVAIERNFITRQQGIDRLNKIVIFLETADRFHGAWSHWVNGATGKVIPFSTKDNGGDLVETSFLVQGLLTFRQYLTPTDTVGNNLINRINKIWEEVEWDWYRKNGENVLYWHWSPNYNWEMNFPLFGYFEEQITYVLAAASPTHSIPKEVYTNGYGKNGQIVTGNTYYGYNLPLGGLAPLFWVQYSYLGLDPHFSDDYANYWTQNVNTSLINYSYCVENPKNYVGYSSDCWGLTSSDNQNGYSAHSPSNDLGVITPTAALSSFPYIPTESMQALKFFYYTIGDRLWGPYGFYDAVNITEGWTASSYLAIDQGPIIVMIENYRTGLLWNLFMSCPEISSAETKLNFIR